MNTQGQLKRFFAPLAVGFGLVLGVGTAAEAFPDNSRTIHHDNSGYHQNNYHRRSFRNIQPFRSLNVTPRYHIPSPADRKRYNQHRYQHSHYGDRYYRGRYEGDQRYGETNSGRNRVRRVRRVNRRGFRIDTNGVEGSR